MLILAFGLIWGIDGALSTAYAIALVLLNFALSAAILSWSARISLGMLMGATLFGFLIRMAIVLVAVLAVRPHVVGRGRAARHHHRRHPPRPALLGDALHLRLTGLPRAQAR